MAKYKNEMIGAASLLAGTAIGSGMISLPMVLAKVGIFGTCVVIFAFMFLIYFTAIIRAEISINIKDDVSSLKQAGEKIGCRYIGMLGDFMLSLLAFSLMMAYMIGGGSIISSLCGFHETQTYILVSLAFAIAFIFLFGSNKIIQINKYLFSFLIVTLFFLIVFLFYRTPIQIFPQSANNVSLNEWGTIITIVFTSFGYHTVTHAIANICHNDRTTIKKACLLGTAIPSIIYVLWTVAILIIVANTDGEFYQMMLHGKATNVGELVKVLSLATSSGNIQTIIWIVSFFAIFTSILGVGFALWHNVRSEWKASKWISAIIVAILPAIVSIIIPNFITVLSAAGIILSIVAIISPVLIDIKLAKNKDNYIPLIKNRFIVPLTFILGIVIIILGILQ